MVLQRVVGARLGVCCSVHCALCTARRVCIMSLTSRWLICVMNLEECRGKFEIRWVDDEVEVLDDWRATT